MALWLFFYAWPLLSQAQETYSPKYAGLVWENDVFNGTDRYFTNGSKLVVFHPILRKNPFDRLVPSLPKSQGDLHGIYIRQDIYTPADVDSLSYLPSDRPYAGCLMVYMQKVSFWPERKIRLNGALGLGFSGDIALGGAVQNAFHTLIQNSVYGGWYNQLGNRLLLNYTFNLEKALNTNDFNQFIGKLDMEIGNVRTNVAIGYVWRLGTLAPYFSPYVYEKGKGKLRYSFFLHIKYQFVMYDATLSGTYLDAGQPDYSIRLFVFRTQAGVNLMYKRFNLTMTQYFLTPEFSTGTPHRYMNIELGYRF